VGGNIVATTKKSTSELINSEGVVDRFCIGRVLFIIRLFHMVSQSVSRQLYLLGGHEVFKRGRVKEERP
jgi:hypothetical protein